MRSQDESRECGSLWNESVLYRGKAVCTARLCTLWISQCIVIMNLAMLMVCGMMGNDEGLPGSPERVGRPCSRVVDGLGKKFDGEATRLLRLRDRLESRRGLKRKKIG